jgi:intracellular sulfur oxidation DsrE/DsrF family protein
MTIPRKLILSAAALLLLILPAGLAFAQSKPHRVLFVLTSSDEADWHMTITNMSNFIKAFPATDTVEVEIVAYGPGLGFLRKASVIQPDLEALEAKHVHFVACENSMRMQHVTAADLAPGVTSVPSGVVEVVSKQEQGWPYIKAGR